MISNCGSDENGRYRNGKAGDQMGKEWKLCKWYSRPWDKVFRFPYAEAANLIGEYAIQAAENDHIGYSQNDRYSFYRALSENNWDIKSLSVDCNADCSSGAMAILKAVGMELDILALVQIRTDMTTRTATAALKKAGFQVLAGKDYTMSDLYLAKGDILLATGKHMAINVTGDCVATSTQKPIKVASARHKDEANYKRVWNVPPHTKLYANKELDVIMETDRQTRVRCYGYYNVWGDMIYLYVAMNGHTGYICLDNLY